jgi:hypothetical protein
MWLLLLPHLPQAPLAVAQGEAESRHLGQGGPPSSLEHEAPAMSDRAEPAALHAAAEGERDLQPVVERRQGARRRRRRRQGRGAGRWRAGATNQHRTKPPLMSWSTPQHLVLTAPRPYTFHRILPAANRLVTSLSPSVARPPASHLIDDQLFVLNLHLLFL